MWPRRLPTCTCAWSGSMAPCRSRPRSRGLPRNLPLPGLSPGHFVTLNFVLMFALARTHSHPDTHHVFCFVVAAGKGGARSVTSSRAVSVLAARARSRCLSSTCALNYQRQSSAQPNAPAFQRTLTFRLTCVQKSPGSRPRWPSGGSSPLPLLDLPVPALLQMGPGSPPPLSPGYVVPLML